MKWSDFCRLYWQAVCGSTKRPTRVSLTKDDATSLGLDLVETTLAYPFWRSRALSGQPVIQNGDKLRGLVVEIGDRTAIA